MTRIVVVPRLPGKPARFTGTFSSVGDVLAECAECGYMFVGSRADAKQAMDQHHRLQHSQETGVVLLNHPRQ